ncbi:ChaC-like protein [Penicillium paradoxum]|uniref:ChaC-like protein n=1 Tax=Penicillium paradoxum TaxID=176176 RepID=UPI00254689AF|nr:ChaC-like protein [Penicillium paradoxum]KAJ5780553.1 ChaC-like protein [Penicillium paradoxum]
MAAIAQGHQVHPEGRTWKSHFPKGDLWELDLETPSTLRAYQAILVAMYDVFGSTDHRGTPEQPGRVVTVIERSFWETLDDPLAHLESESSSTGKVWGAAYHIPASHAEEVHDYLDEREIDGYSAHYTPFHPTTDVQGMTGSGEDQGSSPIICMVYIGQPTNPQFLRDAAHREPQHVAQVISEGHGLSGKNSEYLFMLEKALDGIGLGSADVHVTDLVKKVKAIELEGLAEAEEKEAELQVTRSLEGASETGFGDDRSTIE